MEKGIVDLIEYLDKELAKLAKEETLAALSLKSAKKEDLAKLEEKLEALKSEIRLFNNLMTKLSKSFEIYQYKQTVLSQKLEELEKLIDKLNQRLGKESKN